MEKNNSSIVVSDIGSIWLTAERIFPKIKTVYPLAMKGRSGFALTLVSATSDKQNYTDYTEKILSPPPDKWQIYHDLSIEKAHRLVSHPNHFASYESRDPEHGAFGGAVRVYEYIISISGFTEWLDTAIALTLGGACISDFTYEKAAAIALCDPLAMGSLEAVWKLARNS